MSLDQEHRTLATIPTLVADFVALGIRPGMVLIVHSSLKSLSAEVNGGAVAVVLALEQVLGTEGTLVMPTHSPQLSDPANWVAPPVPEAWWKTMRETMPAFDQALTPTFRMGIIPETFRKQSGVLRSNHPDASFAAWGKHARQITENHALSPLFGEGSPLARIYDSDGWVLLLGVDHNRNTSLHLAEWRAQIQHPPMRYGAPMMVDGVRRWIAWDDLDWSASDFVQLGADFARETGLQREGSVSNARALLIPQRRLIDYGVSWLEHHRQ